MKTLLILILVSSSLLAREYNRYKNHSFWGRPYYNDYDEGRWGENRESTTPVYYDGRIDEEGLLINQTTTVETQEPEQQEK